MAAVASFASAQVVATAFVLVAIGMVMAEGLVCPVGYSCPDDTDQVACVSTASYCPGNTAEPTATSPGYYTIQDSASHSVGQAPCRPGFYCSAGVERACEPGYSSSAAMALCDACVAGFYCPGGSPNITCPAGFTCPGGSSTFEKNPCGGVGVYCPPGSAAAMVVHDGHYSTPADGPTATRTGEALCPRGHACKRGVAQACSAGSFAAANGSTSCSPCDAGYYCPAGSVSQIECGGEDVYCPERSGEPIPVPVGMYSAPVDAGVAVRWQALPCAAGQYCVGGVTHMCPAGRFGCSPRVSDPLCNGPCTAGYYCNAGAVSNVENSCGDVSLYCPSGAAAPLVAASGYATVGGDEAHRTAVELCAQGSYCQHGVATLCPAGRYGSSTGETTSACSGTCSNGYTCPPGSTSPTQERCTQGYYCNGGAETPCPAGRYGATELLVHAEECTPCSPGTSNDLTGQRSALACVPCNGAGSSSAGAVTCWPGLVAVTVADPPPVVAGVTVGDTITLTFDRPTNRPNLGSSDDVAAFVDISADIGTLSALWLSTTELVLTVEVVSPTLDVVASSVDELVVLVRSGTKLMDEDETSQTYEPPAFPLVTVGSWGDPSMPVIVAVTALNTGKQDGLGPFDTLLVEFDAATNGPTMLPDQVPPLPSQDVLASGRAGVDSLLEFSASLGTNYTARWLLPSLLEVLILDGANIDAAGTAMGVLRVSVLPSASLRSADGVSVVSNSSALLSRGWWGSPVTALTVTQFTPSQLQVRWDAPGGIGASISGQPMRYRVSHCSGCGTHAVGVANETGALVLEQTAGWVSQSVAATSLVVAGLPAGVLVMLAVEAEGPDGLWGPVAMPPPPTHGVTIQLPTVLDAMAEGGPMLTPGGSLVVIMGKFLGPMDASVSVRAALDNGAQRLFMECDVVVADSVINCVAVPGVGAAYRVAVEVAGVLGNFSDPEVTLSYQAPVVRSFYGAGASDALTQGGQVVYIEGENLGPIGSEFLSAVAYKSVLSDLVMQAQNCSVVTAHTLVRCFTAEGAGSLLHWNVVVGGQSSSAPTIAYAPPVVNRIEAATPGMQLDQLSSTGGEVVALVGTNFGDKDEYLGGALLVGSDIGSRLSAPSCTIVEPNTVVHCTTPSGTGTGHQWMLNVAGRWSPPSPNRTSFAAPVITSVHPQQVLTSGGTLVINGIGFGATVEDVSVVAPSGVRFASVRIATANTALEVDIPPIAGVRVSLSVHVGSQSSEVVHVPLQVPQVTSIDASSVALRDDGTQQVIIEVIGSSFGYGEHGSSVVTINGTECVQAAATQPFRLYCEPRVAAGPLVVVTNHGMTSAAYPYNADDVLRRPLISFVSPERVPTSGGAVTVTGSEFRVDSSVWLEPIPGLTSPQSLPASPAECVLLAPASASELRVMVPPGQGGPFSLIVSTANGTRSHPSAVGRVTYNPPSVAALQPTAGTAVGGTLLTVTGQSFGSIGLVLVNNKPCQTVSWSHTLVTCRTPPGTTPFAPIVVDVAGTQSSANDIYFEYDGPAVQAVFPNHGVTAGGYRLVVVGRNFGIVQPTVFIGPYKVENLLGHNNTHALLLCPAGIGANHTVVVDTGEQRSDSLPQRSNTTAPQQVLFHYDPPRLDSVAVLPGHSASPAGGFMVALHGASFGPSPAVYIGRVPCGVNATVAQQNYITCTAGPRLSLETYVEVEVQGRVAGGFPRGPQLAFDPPTLVEVSPNIVDAFVGGAIDVKGRNFGHVGAAANNVTIQVGRYACADVALLADTHARCTIASGLDTGEVVATITSWEVQSNAVAVELRCSKGYYAASDGQPCEPCPIGAECGGMLALPVALPGFFSLDSAFVACTPPEACQGGSSSSCLAGYTGELCGACAKQWYRIEQRCKPCPDSAWLLLIAFFVGLVAIMACGVYLQSKAMNFAGFSIGVDALQVYSMFVSFKFNWPTALHSVFASMSLMNFNIELVAPECSVSWTYEQKWYIMQALPLLCSLVYVVPWVALQTCGRCLPNRHSTMERLAGTLGATFTGLYMLYFVVVRNALAVFACSDQGKGVYVMNIEPAITCWEAGGEHARMLPFAYASLVGYGAGIPLLFVSVMLANRVGIKADQELNAQGRGASPLTNQYLPLRLKYRKLYEDFKPAVFWWRLVLLARKLSFACVALLFTDSPLFQACLCSLLLFLSYVIHMKYRPFLARQYLAGSFLAASAERPSVANPAFTRLSAPSKSPPIKNPSLTRGHKSPRLRRRRGPRKSVVLAAKRVGQSMGATVVFDYNHLETLFLVCSLLVLLAGLLFVSGGFQEESAVSYALSVFVVVLVGGSTLVLVGVIAFEMVRAVRFAKVHDRAVKFEVEMHIAAQPGLALSRVEKHQAQMQNFAASYMARKDHSAKHRRNRRGGAALTQQVEMTNLSPP